MIEHAALQNYWYVVAEGTDLADGPLEVTLLGRRLVVYRGPDGAVVAADDRCTHREAPLSKGVIKNGCLECPYHGWMFGDGGTCTLVPSSGEGRPVPKKAHLEVLHAIERYGLVWVCPGEPAAAIPEIPVDTDPAYRRINSGVQLWNANSMRMTDNFMDISHFPYVHVGTFGIDSLQEVPKLELEPLDGDFFGYQYSVEVGNEQGSVSSGSDGDTVHRHMSTGFNLPFTVRSTILYDSGLDHQILLCSTPIDDENAYFTFVVWRNDDHSVPAEEIIAFDRAIGAEDKRMLELIDGVLPLDQTATASVQSDKPSVEWRRRFAALLDN